METRKRGRTTRGSARTENRIAFGKKGELKRFSTTGLIIAYGINSLATTLAASTYTSAPVCSLSWEFWKRRNGLEMADMSTSLGSEGRKYP
jgi:hypothetical protein